YLRVVSIFLSYIESTSPALSPLPLHDALPISRSSAACRRCSTRRPSWPTSSASSAPTRPRVSGRSHRRAPVRGRSPTPRSSCPRSEEHTSELQSRENLVCRLLLEKKKQTTRQV